MGNNTSTGGIPGAREEVKVAVKGRKKKEGPL
jgi:hypothetical protein